MFNKKGVITVPRATQKTPLTEDDLMAVVLDAGADDLQGDDAEFIVTTSPHAFHPVKKAIEDKGITVDTAALQMVPQNTVKVTGKEAEQLMKLMEAIEEHDDVQNVYANFDIDEKELASFNN